MKNTKILVTGLGVISPLGNSVQQFWENCLLGKSGIQEITYFDTHHFPTKIAGEIKNFNPLNYMSQKSAKRYPKYLQYMIAATREAINDAKLDNLNSIGVIVGTGLGGFEIFEKNQVPFTNNHYNYHHLSPFFIPMSITSTASAIISLEFKIRGPSFSINTACASSNHAILAAFNSLKLNDIDIAIVGGTEAPIHPLGLGSFIRIHALSKNNQPEKASRPFDKNRDGFVLSEGAGAIILETEKSAQKRNAFVYAELIGGSMSSDSYHLTQPEPNSLGIIKCLKDLTKSLNIPLQKINYINSHGTSTKLGDRAEQKGIIDFFGKSLSKKIKINSTKSMIGHMLGAASIVEAIATIKSIQQGELHPTINYHNYDPDCPLDCIPNKKIKFPIQIALSNGFGFGGQNSIIAIGHHKF